MDPERIERQPTIENTHEQAPETAESKPGIWKKALEAGDQAYTGAKRLLASAYERFVPNAESKKEQEKNKQELTEARKAHFMKTLAYHPGDGVVSGIARYRTSGSTSGQERRSAIEAPDFRNCAGVILRSPDGVAVIHISPETLPEETRTVGGIDPGIIKDRRYVSHIVSAVRELYPDSSSEPPQYAFSYGKPGETTPLTEDQLARAQDSLQVEIVGGDTNLAFELENNVFKETTQHDNGARLPTIHPDRKDFGTGPKIIIATGEKTFIQSQVDGTVHTMSKNK